MFAASKNLVAIASEVGTCTLWTQDKIRSISLFGQQVLLYYGLLIPFAHFIKDQEILLTQSLFTFFSVIDIVIYQVRQTLRCLYINFIDSMSSIRSSKTANLNVENRSKLAPVSKSPTPDPKNRSVSGSRFMAEPYERPNQDRPKSNHAKSKFDSEMESMEKQLKLHKSKLCSCLEIYSML